MACGGGNVELGEVKLSGCEVLCRYGDAGVLVKKLLNALTAKIFLKAVFHTPAARWWGLTKHFVL